MPQALTDQAAQQTIARPVSRKHRAFCRAVANGMVQAEAYRRYVSSAGEHANKMGWALAHRFKETIAIHRTKLESLAEHASIASKFELMQYLTRAVRTPIVHIDEHSDLCQERIIIETEVESQSDEVEGGANDGATIKDNITHTTLKLKSVNKLDAASQLSKLAGYDAPQLHQHQHLHAVVDTPAIAMLRGRNGSSLSRSIVDKPIIFDNAQDLCLGKEAVESIHTAAESLLQSPAWTVLDEEDRTEDDQDQDDA